jgi:hypothetical protein
MIKTLRRNVTEEKVERTKKLIKLGRSLREAAKEVGISYYSAWHIAKGSYDNEIKLDSIFKKEERNNYFTWKNFEVF